MVGGRLAVTNATGCKISANLDRVSAWCRGLKSIREPYHLLLLDTQKKHFGVELQMFGYPLNSLPLEVHQEQGLPSI
jgi:hypothetical protein